MDSATTSTVRKPFIEHIHEFRRRLIWSCLALFLGGIVGYALYGHLIHLVQKPLGQTLYYTSPTGGFNFAFKICIVFGFVFALPVITYHIFKFLEPISTKINKHTIVAYILWSINLAYLGILFGYFISLPAALHFLTQIGGQNIQSLITADEYFSFALAYIAGFALLFQLPLIVVFFNRITPLKPSGMMKAQKYIILGSFVVAAILTPTPDPVNQLIMAMPIVLLYQFSIVIVWFINRGKKSSKKALPVHSSVKGTDTPSFKKVEQPVVAPTVRPSTAKTIPPPRTLVTDFYVKKPNPVPVPKTAAKREPHRQPEFRVLSRSRPAKLIDITV